MKQIVYSNQLAKTETCKATDTISPRAAAENIIAPQKGEDGAKAFAKPNEDNADDAFDKLTFPERLMYLLQNETEPDALWWQKDGLSFGFEQKRFTESVLNKLFPIRIKFESFIRKLNRWYVISCCFLRLQYAQPKL